MVHQVSETRREGYRGSRFHSSSGSRKRALAASKPPLWRLIAFLAPLAVLAYGLAAATVHGVYATASDTYTSESQILVGPVVAEESTVAGAAASVESFTTALSTDAAIRLFANRAGIPPMPLPEFNELYVVTADRDSRVITVSMTYQDPELARAVVQQATIEVQNLAAASGVQGPGVTVLQQPSTPEVRDPRFASLRAHIAGLAAALGVYLLGRALTMRRWRQHRRALSALDGHDVLGTSLLPDPRVSRPLVRGDGDLRTRVASDIADRVIVRTASHSQPAIVVAPCLGEPEGGVVAAAIAARSLARGMNVTVVDHSPTGHCSRLLRDVESTSDNQGSLHLQIPLEDTAESTALSLRHDAGLTIAYTDSAEHAIVLARRNPMTQLVICSDLANRQTTGMVDDMLTGLSTTGDTPPAVVAYRSATPLARMAARLGVSPRA